MAYYLLRTDRHREALWAVAAAQSLEDDNPHLFCGGIPLPGRCWNGVWIWLRRAQAAVALTPPFSQLPGEEAVVVTHSG